jgi:hypothetical protein
MQNPTLDRTRDFGTIHGEHEHGATYSQDGFFFDASGDLIEAALDAAGLKRLEQRKNQDAAILEAKSKLRELMPDLTAEQLDKVVNVQALNAPESQEITREDLALWAAGQKQIVFATAKKAITALFDQSPVNKQQAIEILAANGIGSFTGAPTIPATT